MTVYRLGDFPSGQIWEVAMRTQQKKPEMVDAEVGSSEEAIKVGGWVGSVGLNVFGRGKEALLPSFSSSLAFSYFWRAGWILGGSQTLSHGLCRWAG